VVSVPPSQRLEASGTKCFTIKHVTTAVSLS
jgi:hypothetical protein